MKPALIVALAVAVIAGGPNLSAASGGPHWSGMLLRRALDELRSMGLDIIYSSDLVRPSMWITTEPRATDPKKLLDEILAPHGLATLPGPGGRILIVRTPGREEPRAMEPPAGEPEPGGTCRRDAGVEHDRVGAVLQVGDGPFELGEARRTAASIGIEAVIRVRRVAGMDEGRREMDRRRHPCSAHVLVSTLDRDRGRRQPPHRFSLSQLEPALSG